MTIFSSSLVIQNFKNISNIPRGSGNELEICNFIKDFSKKLGLESYQDEHLNLIVKKPAQNTKTDKTVMLQAHIDMVTEASDHSNHDFEKDPIEIIIDGNIIRANNTTLGADNGIGVAYMLSILEAEDIIHPNLECVFTSSEEVGLIGANNIDLSDLRSTFVINLDAEEDDSILTGCAGAINSTISLKKEYKPVTPTNIALEVTVHGLCGGHSGMDIDKQRGNSIKILGRVLNSINRKFDIFYLDGGSKRNVIPRYAEAVLSISDSDLEDVVNDIQRETRKIQKEVYKVDPNLRVSLRKSASPDFKVYTDNCKRKILALLNLIPNGVVNTAIGLDNLVETSTNLAVLAEKSNKIEFLSLTRSSSQSRRDYLTKNMAQLAEAIGAKIDFTDEYPAWEYNPNSKLEDLALDVYIDTFGKKPNVKIMHCGLESGIILNKLNHYAEAISIGPNIYNVHSPSEYAEIDSIEKIYKYLVNLLEKISE